MRGRGRDRRGLSVGTVVMLTLTALVVVGFCALLPKVAGNVDIKLNAAELAVAIDNSISQIAASAVSPQRDRQPDAPMQTLAPENLATAAPVTPPPKLNFSLCLAGRVNIDQNMQKTLTDDAGYQFQILFDQMGAVMQSDLTVASLADNYIPTDKLSDLNLPVEALAAIKGAGIDALSVAHPSLLDSGMDGLQETLQSVRGAGITAYGAYADESARSQTILYDANGVKVALLGFVEELSGNSKKRASEEERAVAVAELTIEEITAEIARARESGAQVVLVSLCWGKTGATETTDKQRTLAQQIANAGADVILGYNPEAAQSMELLTADRGDSRYHPVLCAYSMGNLVTNNRKKGANLAGLLLKAQVEFDPSTDTVAFDELSYTPLYNWRGSDGGKTLQRVLVSNAPLPEFVDQKQKQVLERCLKIVRDLAEGTGFLEK